MIAQRWYQLKQVEKGVKKELICWNKRITVAGYLLWQRGCLQVNIASVEVVTREKSEIRCRRSLETVSKQAKDFSCAQSSLSASE